MLNETFSVISKHCDSRYDGSNDLTTGEYYNPAANVWQPTTPMGTRRSCLGICGYDGLIYCVGGYDGASCLSSVERYDPLTAMWTSCPAMSTKRRYCRSVVLGKKASPLSTKFYSRKLYCICCILTSKALDSLWSLWKKDFFAIPQSLLAIKIGCLEVYDVCSNGFKCL